MLQFCMHLFSSTYVTNVPFTLFCLFNHINNIGLRVYKQESNNHKIIIIQLIYLGDCKQRVVYSSRALNVCKSKVSKNWIKN
jgi:hypothetical protein